MLNLSLKCFQLSARLPTGCICDGGFNFSMMGKHLFSYFVSTMSSRPAFYIYFFTSIGCSPALVSRVLVPGPLSMQVSHRGSGLDGVLITNSLVFASPYFWHHVTLLMPWDNELLQILMCYNVRTHIALNSTVWCINQSCPVCNTLPEL